MKIRYFIPMGLLGFIFCGMLAQGAAAVKKGFKLEPFDADRATSSGPAPLSAKTHEFEAAASAFIGVGVAHESQDTGRLRKALGPEASKPGALIIKVLPGSPAASAGVREGDLVIAAGHTPIKNAESLTAYLGRQKIGATVKLNLLRPQAGGRPKRMSVEVRIARRPAHEALSRALRENQPRLIPQTGAAELGIAVEPDTRQGKRGLRITALKSKSLAERAGLAVGDLLLEVNKVPLQTAQDLPRAIDTRPGRPALIAYLRQGNPALVAIDLH